MGAAAFIPWKQIAGAVGGTISGIAQLITGNKEIKRGNKLMAEAEAMNYSYDRPDEIKSLTAETESRSYGKSSIQKMLESDARENSNRFTGNVQRNATSGAQSLAMLTEGQKMESDAMRGAAIEGEKDKTRQQQESDDAKKIAAEYSDKEHEYNVREPYINKLTEAQETLASGRKNKSGAWQSFGQMVAGSAPEGGFNLKKKPPIPTGKSKKS